MSSIPEKEFPVDGKNYRSRRMSAFDQQAVAAKLGGVLLVMGMGKPSAERTAENFTKAYCATLGDLRKTDMDLVTGLCLTGVTRQQGETGWSAIRTPDGQMAFEDINLPEMLIIVWEVLTQHRIPDFFFENESKSSHPKVPT